MAGDLRTLQFCLLDVALEFKRICEKHNLKYFLAYGSMLGAVRHKGFIPWDDDMDVGMPREDYEKFIEVCKDELSEDYFLQSCETDEGYGFGYVKICINGTLLVEDYAENSSRHNGIFFDIFPYDVMPENKLKQKLQFITYKSMKWAALGKCDFDFKVKKRKMFAKAMKLVFFPFKKNKLIEMENKVCRWFDNCKSGKLINVEWYQGVIEQKDLDDMLNVEFEGYEFTIPRNYHDHLVEVYGDYMTLPPESERGKQHSIINMDLGNYVIKNNAYKQEKEA